MGDNLEVSLYGQRFEPSLIDRLGGGETVTHRGILPHDVQSAPARAAFRWCSPPMPGWWCAGPPRADLLARDVEPPLRG
ncbi:hypothetical protein [Mycolicibacterium sarraceniae]|uniref:hypothetical protein n=1 Tax=Mycolicibacterium sarraceniae TaxID=1534348 RepID=UPI001F1BCBF1|nr:hypothetical protein [Mycolicibacterium sarraceniae]